MWKKTFFAQLIPKSLVVFKIASNCCALSHPVSQQLGFILVLNTVGPKGQDELDLNLIL